MSGSVDTERQLQALKQDDLTSMNIEKPIHISKTVQLARMPFREFISHANMQQRLRLLQHTEQNSELINISSEQYIIDLSYITPNKWSVLQQHEE